MNKPDRQNIARMVPEKGEIALFHDLDLDTVREQRPSSQRSSFSSYTVDGKVRKMYVLAVLWKRGKRRFCVVPITHSGKDEQGSVREDRIRIGNCVTEGDEKPSFFRLPEEELRESLLCREDGKSPVVEPCNRLAFDAATKLLHWRLARDESRSDGSRRQTADSNQKPGSQSGHAATHDGQRPTQAGAV